jgi:hypothetical protein
MRHRLALVLLAALVSLAATCAASSRGEISRERAMEIARQHVSFQPDSVQAERAAVNARPVWRVTLRGRLPGQPPGLFETAIVEIDRRSGEVVSMART